MGGWVFANFTFLELTDDFFRFLEQFGVVNEIGPELLKQQLIRRSGRACDGDVA